ncbi:MAG TPA: glycosyltransferase family protein, partial [Methylomirabilota bacterium]|nr:glycosyltransferase family protein [Methylomirabilota bacterium]
MIYHEIHTKLPTRPDLMQVLALIQARMGSTRLPGKVLGPVLGKPMLQWQLERVALSKRISKTVVATSTQPQDTAIYEFCRSIGALAFRGSETSVLDRFYDATLAFLRPEERQDAILVRLTADCPLVDPFMVDEGIERFLKARAEGCRYQGYEADMPDGMDFEVFTWEALDEVYHTETDEFEKEHATPYMWRHPARFGLQKFSKPEIPGGLRCSVDYAEDRDLVEEILRRQEERGSFWG